MKKGQIWISAVLYTLIIIVLIVVVIEAGIPLLSGLQDRNSFNRAKETLVNLDSHIQELAKEGQGSQRVIPIAVDAGTISVSNERLRWKIETDSKLVEPGTRQELGNLVISSDIDVTSRTAGSFYVLENSRIFANFTALGSPTNWTTINTTSLLNSIRFKDTNTETSGSFIFTLNDSSSQNSGTGYTELVDVGDGLTKASLRAHINATLFQYDLMFTLRSKADFLQVEVKNFKRK